MKIDTAKQLKLISAILLLIVAAIAAYDLYGPQKNHAGTILTQATDVQSGSTRGGSRRFEYRAVLIKVENQKEGLMVRSGELWQIAGQSTEPLAVKVEQTPILGTLTKVMVNGVEFDVRFGGLHWQMIFAFTILALVLLYVRSKE